MTDNCDEYTGRRILEAMHSATLYGDTIFNMLRSAKPHTRRPILDFGAGDGLFARKFLRLGIAVDCVEPDRGLRAGLVKDTHYVHSDIRGVSAGRYDFIYSINVLEHITHLDAALTELFRVAAPDGKLFIFVPAFAVLWTKLDDEVGHVRRFRRKGLTNALQRAGFKVEDARHFDLLGFPAALTVRLLERLNLFSYTGGTVGFYDRYVFPASHWLDRITGGFFGKNLIAVARKPN